LLAFQLRVPGRSNERRECTNKSLFIVHHIVKYSVARLHCQLPTPVGEGAQVAAYGGGREKTLDLRRHWMLRSCAQKERCRGIR
jgi:hypothetical protein